MSITAPLAPLRAHGGARLTAGLDDETLERFADDPRLAQVVAEAATAFEALSQELTELQDLDEVEQIKQLQSGYVNFYPEGAVNPYVALAGRGPWVVTLAGAVIFDAGGYGMLGLGHAPQAVLDMMARPQVMANIMTPSLAHLRFERAVRREVGHARPEGSPYSHVMCLNSGSEAVGLAARIVDTHAKSQTDQGGPHAGAAIKRLVVKGSFHGRTDRPALYSDSSRESYDRHLASYRGEDSVITVQPYDEDALRDAFATADREGWFVEAMFLEPVMGEGDPGRAVPPAYYALARELTLAHGSMLLVDSIQAGIRATGTLSVVDYPGFERLPAPDLETWSKAINAGQYPLSVLGLSPRAAQVYATGTYGNTMTANPRALDVACVVLDGLDDEVRRAIRERGVEALELLRGLQREMPECITGVQGTGLLFSCELSPEFAVLGAGSTEEWLRRHGLGVIHGGENSLRFTPPFDITSEQLHLVVELVRRALVEGPRAAAAATQEDPAQVDA